jgi:hypothetical protein
MLQQQHIFVHFRRVRSPSQVGTAGIDYVSNWNKPSVDWSSQGPVEDKTADTLSAVDRIREEIDRLTREQTEALKSATFVGLTTEDAKVLYRRRLRITELMRELELYEKAH